MDERLLSLYRAITGRGRKVNEIWTHEGVSDEELRENGMLCSNFSFDQCPPRLTADWDDYPRYGADTTYDVRVSGLPVFLNFAEAKFWLERKNYDLQPAIVEAQVPLTLIVGNSKRIILAQNSGQEYSYEKLEAHISGNKLIRGEHYIESVGQEDLGELLHPYQTFHRPLTKER